MEKKIKKKINSRPFVLHVFSTYLEAAAHYHDLFGIFELYKLFNEDGGGRMASGTSLSGP